MSTIEDMCKKIASVVVFGIPINASLTMLIEKPLSFPNDLHLSLVSVMLAAAWLKHMHCWFKE